MVTDLGSETLLITNTSQRNGLPKWDKQLKEIRKIEGYKRNQNYPL
jgi:hypothetical protein